MRRIVPWALLIALLVGVGVGAVVGQAQTPGQTPTQWVDGVLAATKAAGTARITYVSELTSATPAQQSSTTGSGVVDFRTGSVKVTEVSRSYQSSSTDGGPCEDLVGARRRRDDRYREVVVPEGPSGPGRRPRERPAPAIRWGSTTRSARSRSARSAVGSQWRASRTSEPATVGGVATTRYLVTTRLPSCTAVQAAFEAGNYWRPTTLWVDSQGRLVQARSALHLDLKIPQSLQEELLKQEEKALQKASISATEPDSSGPPEEPHTDRSRGHNRHVAPGRLRRTGPHHRAGHHEWLRVLRTSQSMLSKTVLLGGGGRVAVRSHTC